MLRTRVSGSAVLIHKFGDGSSGGLALTARHVAGNVGIGDTVTDQNGNAYTVSAKYIYDYDGGSDPYFDVAILAISSNVSALPVAILANTIPAYGSSFRMAGFGVTATGIGGGIVAGSEALRWATVTSVEPNVAATIKQLNWKGSFENVANAGFAQVGDSGGGIFAESDFTLYGWILGPGGPPQYGLQTGGGTVVSIRAWIQSIIGNPAAKYIKGIDFDATNLKARVKLSDPVDWTSAGSQVYLTDTGVVYRDTGAIYGGGSGTGVSQVDIVVESTGGGRTTGGSQNHTFDVGTGAFTTDGIGNVAVTEALFIDLPMADGEVSMGTPQLSGAYPITLKLGHNGTAFSNTTCFTSTSWNMNLAAGAGTGAMSIGDPFGRQLVDGGAGGDGTSTTAGTTSVSGTRAFGTNAIDADFVQSADTSTPNAPYTDQPYLLDWGPDLTITNGVASFASTSISNNTARYRSVTPTRSCRVNVAAGGSANAGVETRCNNVMGTLKGSAVTGTTVNSFTVTAGERFGVGHLNTSGGTLSVSTTITFTVGVPSVTNATAPVGGQSSSGLVCTRNAEDDTAVNYFKITGITNGTLYKNDGVTAIANNAFITYAEGNAGLKFSPSGALNGSFQVTASVGNDGTQLSSTTATATITVGTPSSSPAPRRLSVGVGLGL